MIARVENNYKYLRNGIEIENLIVWSQKPLKFINNIKIKYLNLQPLVLMAIYKNAVGTKLQQSRESLWDVSYMFSVSVQILAYRKFIVPVKINIGKVSYYPPFLISVKNKILNRSFPILAKDMLTCRESNIFLSILI